MPKSINKRGLITAAVLGLGSIGLRHARNLRELGVQVIGFDPSPERVDMWRKEGGEVVADRAVAIEAADAVIIASPSGQHLPDMMAAISAGKHVLIEKPIAHTDNELDELFADAERRGVVVAAALNLRFLPAVEQAQRLVAQGRLGTPLWARLICATYLPDWRPYQNHLEGYANNSNTGGVLFDIVHEFDLAHLLLGPAEAVAAVARNTGSIGLSAEDCADILLRHDGGIVSNLHLDYVTRPRRRIVEVGGTAGLLSLEVSDNRLTLYGSDGAIVEQRKWDEPASDSYRSEMQDFLEAVRGGGKPRCSGREALTVLRVVLAARKLAGLSLASSATHKLGC